MTINIVLLEFFVDTVKIDEHVRDQIPNLQYGQLCVSFKFLDFPPLHVYQEMQPGAPPCMPPVFRCGRSGLFSVPELINMPADLFKIDIEVLLKTMPTACPQCPDITNIGQTSINLTRDFSVITAEAKAYPNRVPITRTLRDSFLIANYQKKVVGVVSVFIRASCFGSMIVQQFKRTDTKTCLEEGTECPAPCGNTAQNYPGKMVVAPCVQNMRNSNLAPCNPTNILPRGLLESLKDGISRGLDPNALGCLGEFAVGGGVGGPTSSTSWLSTPRTETPRRRHRRDDFDDDYEGGGEDNDDDYEGGRGGARGDEEDTCPCKEDALAATAPRPPGVKFDEIGTEMNGTFLTIRVPRSDKKPSQTRRDLQGLAAKYGYVLPNPVACICSEDVCTCGARQAEVEAEEAELRAARRERRRRRRRRRREGAGGGAGEGDARCPYGALCVGAGAGADGAPSPEQLQMQLLQQRLEEEQEQQATREPDFDNDIFVLKIGSKRDGERDPPKRAKLELLLRTPKRAGTRLMASTETQYLKSDVPPGTPKSRASSKGRGGKGKKGKKGKK